MSKKMQFDREDYLKVNRKLSREEEIKTHGRPVRIGGVHKSKKVYDRKRRKADDKRHLPSFFLYGWHTDKAPKRSNQITTPCHF